MRHHIFQPSLNYQVGVLIKPSAFNKAELIKNYVTPLELNGVPGTDVIAFTLDYNEVGKAPAGFCKDYLAKLLPALDGLGVKYLYCADSTYFKVLTGSTKAEPHFGYVLPCKIKGYEHLSVVLGLNHSALIFNPDLQAKLDLSLETLASAVQGNYKPLGQGIIHSAHYPQGLQEVRDALQRLHQYPSLTADIEAFSLRFNEAGIGTIAFAWDKHNGLAFPVDYKPTGVPELGPGLFGIQEANKEVRALIKEFLETYRGKLTWHKVTYDVKVLIYVLWMKDLLDTEGLLTGLEVMTRNMHDTRIVAYLATNSTTDISLSLKALAHEFAGNWAVEEITDIRAIPLPKLLQYNLVDTLSTQYVLEKYWPIIVQDQQEELYTTLMMPSQKTIIQMELTGMPMFDEDIQRVRTELEAEEQKQLAIIEASPVIQAMNLLVQTQAMEAANAKLKVKQHPLSKFADVRFNPNSPQQLQELLYNQMQLPVIDYTKTRQPATGADTLKKLINHATDPAHKALMQAFRDYSKVNKILTTFIPAFEEGVLKADGYRYLHGWYNLGGTVSGRLSSSDPNMQNLPAGSTYGKLIKTCFKAPPGWLFCGADFSSLEDRINALLTKDPNKLKVYTDGYDGHCLRAFSYFGDEMSGIVDSVASINTIETLYPKLRQDSKAPTFALTFQGTFRTLMKNLGWTEEKARKVEENYQRLYQVSMAWVKDKIQEATQKGYAIAAFGLRIRTPLLAQTYLGTGATPKEAEAEARTLGNAISGQSYGLLNSRAMNVVMDQVRESKYRLDILPVSQIHDAGYYLIRDNAETVQYANKLITDAMSWQELPEIEHPDVKLGAQLDIFWPDWSQATTLPVDASTATIRQLCNATKEKVLAVA